MTTQQNQEERLEACTQCSHKKQEHSLIGCFGVTPGETEPERCLCVNSEFITLSAGYVQVDSLYDLVLV